LQRLHIIGEGGDVNRSLDFTRYLPFRDYASHAVWGLGQPPSSLAHVAGGLTRATSAPPLPSLDGSISAFGMNNNGSGGSTGSNSGVNSGNNSGANSVGPSTPIPASSSSQQIGGINVAMSPTSAMAVGATMPLAGSIRRSLADSAASTLASAAIGLPPTHTPSSSFASRDWACLDMNTLAVIFDRGPLILLSFGVGGGRSLLSFRHRDIIAQRLAAGEIEQCVQLLSALLPPGTSSHDTLTRTTSLTEEKRPTNTNPMASPTATSTIPGGVTRATTTINSGVELGGTSGTSINDNEQLLEDEERHVSLVMVLNALLRRASSTPPSVGSHGVGGGMPPLTAVTATAAVGASSQLTSSPMSIQVNGGSGSERQPSILKQISTIFHRFWPIYRSEISRYHRSITALYIRFFHLLLRLDRPRRAYFAATQLATPQVGIPSVHNNLN
jgi:hypothetical protein